uniref:DUF4371 domain-containing protein n=1 Tax=Echeneis naucrates TaxID=173247 RepID=A0A665UYW9_ECHNA
MHLPWVAPEGFRGGMAREKINLKRKKKKCKHLARGKMDRFLVSQMKVREGTESGVSRKRRKYDPGYLKFGFSCIGPDDAPLPQYVICKEVLANDSMRPCKLQRHIETKHQSLTTKPQDFFGRKLNELQSQEKVIEAFGTVNTKVTEISYCVVLRIAMSLVRHCSSLLAKIQYVFSTNGRSYCCQAGSLPACTTAAEIFNTLNDFVQENHIDWSRCCGICTDGARAMTGRHSSLVKQVQAVASTAVWSHCTIHHQALATKRMPKEVHAVLDKAVKIVNLIKSRTMNARLFSTLCNEMGAHFHQVLLHSEFRWLSRGKFLTRLCDLHVEVLMFLAQINSPLVKHMEDAKWVAKLAYLSDIFDQINTLNTSLQGKECHVFLAHDQVSAFKKKLDLWCACIERGSVEMFPTLEDVMEKTELQLDCVQQVVIADLKGLREHFGDYFGEETLSNQWVRNTFSFPVTPRDGLTMQSEEALVELNSNMDFKQKMSEASLAHWLSVETEFPHLTKKAVKVFILYLQL